MTYTAASHQGAIEMFWLHFWGAVTPSIFIQFMIYTFQSKLPPFTNAFGEEPLL